MITVQSMNALLAERKAMHAAQVYATTTISFFLYGLIIVSTALIMRARSSGQDLVYSDFVEIDLITPFAMASPASGPAQPGPQEAPAAAAQPEPDTEAPQEVFEPEPPSEPQAATSLIEPPDPEQTPRPRPKAKPRPPAVTRPSPQPHEDAGAPKPGDGSLSLPGVPTGTLDSTALLQPGYSWYKLAILRKVSQNWMTPLDHTLREGTSVTVHFFIMKDGTVEDLKVVDPSGHSVFDRAAFRAILKSSPLPPLPSELGRSRLGVKYRFEYRR